MFLQHQQQPEAARTIDYLAAYNLTDVLHAQTYRPGDNRLRTVVVKAIPTQQSPSAFALTGEVVIKIVPAPEPVIERWAKNEMRLHYILSQMDAENVRGLRPDNDETIFRVDKDGDPETWLKYDTEVVKAIVTGTSWSVVPLYDFALRLFTLKEASIANSGLLTGIPAPNETDPTGYMTQRYFAKTVFLHANDLPLVQCGEFLKNTFIQVAAVLHPLMAIKFTHNDLSIKNMAYMPFDGGEQKDLFHQVATNQWVIIREQQGSVALVDFGFSRAEFSDASKKKWKLVPDKDMLDFRFPGGHNITPAQTFAPVLDLYRIVESMCNLLAEKMITSTETTSLDKFRQLAEMMLAVLTRLPPSFADDKLMIKSMKSFVEKLKTNWKDAKGAATSLKQSWDSNLWASLHKSLPNTQDEILKLAVPWDVLSATADPLYRNPPTQLGTTPLVDMTFRPIVGPGRRYLPNRPFVDDQQARLLPLQ